MHQLQIFNMANMSLNVIYENKILMKISEFTVVEGRDTWVKVFSILRLTSHRNSASKC